MDKTAQPGVSHVLDFEKEWLPFADRSVDHVFSSHCFEHIVLPNNIWSEISRVAKVGATIEIWTPYPHSDDQLLLGHVTNWSWSAWDHLASRFREFYSKPFLCGGYWRWVEARYHVQMNVYERMKRNGYPLEIAVHHFNNVVREWGCFFEYTMDDPGDHEPLETYCHERYGVTQPLVQPQVAKSSGEPGPPAASA